MRLCGGQPPKSLEGGTTIRRLPEHAAIVHAFGKTRILAVADSQNRDRYGVLRRSSPRGLKGLVAVLLKSIAIWRIGPGRIRTVVRRVVR